MHRPITLAAAAGGLVLTLAGCGVQTGTPTSGGAATAAGGDASSASPSAPGFSQLGASVKYPDGLVVSTSKATRFKPSQFAYGVDPGEVAVRVTITATNGMTKVYDSTLLGAVMTYGTAGEDADLVTDLEVKPKVSCATGKKVAPGDKVTATCGFAVPKAALAAPVQVEVQLGDIEHANAVFRGKVG
jgi:hypothetical protein